MKNKKTELLFSLLLFSAAIVLTGCSLTGTRPASGRFEATGKSSSRDASDQLSGVNQKRHGDNSENAVQRELKAPGDSETAGMARLMLGILSYEKGDFEKAIGYLESMQDDARDPFLVSKVLGLSHFRLDQYPQAIRHLRKAHQLNPNDGEILYSLGLIYEKENAAEEAKECFRNIVAMLPGSQWAEHARAHLEALQNASTWSTVYGIEDDEVRRLILGAPGQEDYPEAGAVVLLDAAKLTVTRDLNQTREIHQVIKILNERGKRHAEVPVRYDSLNETVRIDLARTIKPDGTIVNVGKEAMRDLTPWSRFPLYSSSKVKVISMPEVVNGAIIEYKATISSTKFPFENHFTSYFRFQRYDPVMVSRYILEVPEDLGFKTHYLHTDPIQPRIERFAETEGGSSGARTTGSHPQEERFLRYIWEMKEVSAIELERRMPGVVDIAPMVLVSSFPDWKDFIGWWWNLAKDRIEADEAIREKVLELTLNKKTPEDKARAIYGYVASEIRYVGLEYGKRAFRPHHPRQVFANKYGDCKDQAILLVTMLREVEISAYPVLIGTRGRMWELQRPIPMSQFNHVIVLAEIRGREIWLDPTSWISPFGDLPGNEQGREVLVFFDDGARFLTTPVVPPERNKEVQEIEIGISTDGVMSVKARVTVGGWVGQGIRYLLKSRDHQGRIDEVKDLINGYCPGAILEGCAFSQLDDPSLPVVVEYQFSAPDYIKKAGDLLVFRLPWLLSEANGVGKDNRKHPIVWPNTRSDETRISVRIPEGYRVRSIPEGFDLKLTFASHRLDCTSSGRRIIVRNFEEQRALSIGVDQYADYKEYRERIAREVDKPIILEKIRVT